MNSTSLHRYIKMKIKITDRAPLLLQMHALLTFRGGSHKYPSFHSFMIVKQAKTSKPFATINTILPDHNTYRCKTACKDERASPRFDNADS